MGETAETSETAEPCETVDLAPAAVLVRHGRICTAIPMEEIYASIAKPGIFTPHHYMTFFKVIHRALPTNTRFNGSKLCRLGCGCTETFVHWFHCKHIFPIWRAMANILTALGCGQYNCNRELVFLTLKRLRNGERRLITG